MALAAVQTGGQDGWERLSVTDEASGARHEIALRRLHGGRPPGGQSDARSGALLHPRVSLPEVVSPNGYANDITVRAMAVDERTGRVFVSAGGYRTVGRVSMLDARSGAVLWSARVGW